jgi:hypothetical protein
MMEPGVPVFDRRDAEIYGWRFEPDAEGNLWLRVIDGQGAICFRSGSHLTFDGDGNLHGNAPFTGLDGWIHPDGDLWLSEGTQISEKGVGLSPDTRAVIFAPGGSLWFEGGKILSQGVEFAGVLKLGPAEPSA